MTYDVGDQVTLSTTVKDTSGAPADATMAIAVTKPDGTAAAPAGPAHGGTGQYSATVLADAAGRWRYTWTASGAVTAVESGQFDVVAAAAYVVSLEDLKKQLNKTGTADDDELRGYLAAATRYVEWRTGGPVSVQTFTERHWLGPGDTVITRRRPLVSITSITPDFGSALDLSAYAADTDLNVVRLLHGLSSGWYTIVYKAGTTPAENVQLAGKIVAQHLWQTQNGFGGRPFPTDEVVMTGLGFAVPRRAEQLLGIDQMDGIS